MIKFAKPIIDQKSLLKIKKIFRTGHFVHGEFTEQFENNLNNYNFLRKTLNPGQILIFP